MKKFLLFTIGYMISANAALAQLDLPRLPNLNLAPVLSLKLDPPTPLPNSSIAITAGLSGIANVNNSTYTWFLNGKKEAEASGLNKNDFAFTAGAIGSIYQVRVAIITPTGDNLSDSINLTVSDVDLTWDANTEAPLNYYGKLLPTKGSFVTVSALPLIYRPGTKSLINSTDLVYNWKLNDKFDSQKSGVDKSIYNFRTTDFAGGAHRVRLEIRAADGAASLDKSVLIPIVAPQTLVYLSDAKTNLPYGGALKNLTTGPMSLNFIAKNYFFNKPADQLKWQWMIDNKEISGGGDQPWLATFNIPSNINRPFFTQIQVAAKNPVNEPETSQSTINLEVR